MHRPHPHPPRAQVRRPTDYIPPVNHSTEGLKDSHPALYAAVSGMAKIKSVVSTNVPDGPNKIYLGSIPNHLRPDQVTSKCPLPFEKRYMPLRGTRDSPCRYM